MSAAFTAESIEVSQASRKASPDFAGRTERESSAIYYEHLI
jgi:hypothetical protein